MLARTPRGRVATEAAWRHLNLEPPAGHAGGTAGDQGEPPPALFGP
jgi:Holliday junction DNA helicase RuvB